MFKNLGQINLRSIVLMLVILFLALVIGSTIPKLPPLAPLVIIVGIIAFIVTLINTDFGLIVLLFSMLLSPELKIAEVPQRAVVIRIDDILLGIVFFTWLAKMAINKELGLLKSTPLNRPIAIYLLVSILFTMRGVFNGEVNLLKSSFYIIKYIEYFMLYFMFVNNIRNKSQIKLFMLILFITSVLVSLNAYRQISIGVPRVTAPFEGEIGEPNTFGGYLLLMMGIAFGLLLYSTSTRNRLLLGALICLMVLPFLYTLSRGSFLGFIPMYLTLIIVTKKRKLFFIGLLIVTAVLAPLIIPKPVRERIEATFIPGREYEFLGAEIVLAPAAVARVETWRWILKEKWPQRPLIGHGITGSGFIDSQYFRILAELGAIGFLVFIWLIGVILKNSFRIFKILEDSYAKGLALGFLAGFVGLLTQALTANTFIIVRIMEPFWFLTAVVMVLPEISQSEKMSIQGGGTFRNHFKKEQLKKVE